MAMSEADKIRRAEEIYYKRRYNQNYRGYTEQRKKHSFIRWFIGKVIYISLIVACVYGYNNKDYFLSDKFKEDFNSFIKTPINVDSIFKRIHTNEEESVEKLDENQENDSVTDSENIIQNSEVQNDILLVNVISAEILKTAYVKDKEMTEEEYIKNMCDFVLPVKAKVSSRYGTRTSKYQNVSKNHTGIDLAANTGTDIVSAIDGTVVEVSSEGNYGKHLKIASLVDENITTLYAHCSKITVKEGDVVDRGDKIAEVGNTGNTTGAHLHFEIRYEDEYINPEDIMEF